ncbi:MAG: ABC transporter ATP-binding protein [Candidatus Bipolaricaulota bacterium]
MYAVDMKEITKTFGDTVANDGVDLSVEEEEIHCILGENGAGKTTLMNVLFGLYERDAGEIFLHGKEVNIRKPSQAIDHGIGMIHQNFMLVNRLSVTDNIVAGAEPKKGIRLDRKKAVKDVRRLSEKYGLKVDPEARIENISVGDQQRVEILKALYRKANILILDEPTAVLTPQEVEDLFRIMRELKESGKTLIFITHKLKETMTITDRITILRDGKKVGTVETGDTNPRDLAQMMVGRDVVLSVEKSEREERPVSFEVKDLNVHNPENNLYLRDVSFEIEEGEVLGVAGVEGNGQLELEEGLMGLRPTESGEVILRGSDLRELTTRERKKIGIAHIPSDRLRRGLIAEFNLQRNMILGSEWDRPFSRRGFLDRNRIKEYTEEVIEDFDIRGGASNVDVKSLSGGNQQKVILGRELTRDPELIIAAQPTRGVDVGAIEYIHGELLNMRDRGVPVLLISAELDELRSLSDRIIVLYEGEIVASLDADAVDERELGLLMAGEEVEG